MLSPDVVCAGGAIGANDNSVVTNNGLGLIFPSAMNDVIACATNHDIAATAGFRLLAFSDIDAVVAAPLRINGFNALNGLYGVHDVALDIGVGADNNVVAPIAVKNVAPILSVRAIEVVHGTTDDDVVAATSVDTVFTTHRGIGRPHILRT